MSFCALLPLYFCVFLVFLFFLKDENVEGMFLPDFIAFYMYALRRILVRNILFGSTARWKIHSTSSLKLVLYHNSTACPFSWVFFLPVEKQSGKYVCVNVHVGFILSSFYPYSIFVFKNAFKELVDEGNGSMNWNFVGNLL